MEALRQREQAEPLTCIREESFPEMFAALGYESRQDEIRKREKDKSHCFLLKKSCVACIDLPEDFGPVRAGSVCPNNPYEARKEELAEREANAWLVDMAVASHRELAMRGRLDEEASTAEYTLAAVYGEFVEAKRAWQKL